MWRSAVSLNHVFLLLGNPAALELELTAEQEAHPTPKTIKKRAALAEIDTNIEPADKEAGEQPRKKNRGRKEEESKTPEETGVILQLEEFDEQ